MEQQPAPGFTAYVVWVPVMGGAEADAAKALSTIPDARAAHFWDDDTKVGQAFGKILDLPYAWDVYLLYGPDAKWDGDAPPAPAYWQQQLATLAESNVPVLDGKALGEHAAAMLRP